jgi:hypothetical protein
MAAPGRIDRPLTIIVNFCVCLMQNCFQKELPHSGIKVFARHIETPPVLCGI